MFKICFGGDAICLQKSCVLEVTQVKSENLVMNHIQWQARQNNTKNFNGNYESQKAWADVLQYRREQRCPPRLLQSAKQSIKIDGERKTFHDKDQIKAVSINPDLQKALEEKFQFEEISNTQEETRNK